ncbi:MAG TPA: hypothetical protein EYG18_05800 [Micavibrio sp.]|nr:hypothetical protein [Micavibrio sp.]HIL28764.1 hypothetical protein [Micavibrio sp.]
MRKNLQLLMIVIVACLATGFLYAKLLQHKSTSTQYKETTKVERCDDKPLTLLTEEETFLVNRTGLIVRSTSDESISALNMKCDVKEIENVQSFSWASMQIYFGRKEDAVKSYYTLWNDQWLKHQNTLKTLQNGIKKVQTNNSQLYLLPNTVKDYSNLPILFYCSGDEESRRIIKTNYCSTFFHFNKNLYVSYRFFRRHYSESEFIAAHDWANKIVEDMRISDRDDSRKDFSPPSLVHFHPF